jgi:hypothetical protein
MTIDNPEAAIDQAVEDLTLLLLYLSSWEEQVVGDMTVYRAWKGYLFDTLNALEEAGYLDQTRRAKSLTLTGSGIERARALAVQYLGDAAADW